MSDYTPTTEEVREEFIFAHQEVDMDDCVVVSFDEANARWERWLAAVKAEALREAFKTELGFGKEYTVPEVNVGDKIRVTHLQRGVRRTSEGVVADDYAGAYYTEQGEYLGSRKEAEKPEDYEYDTYTIEVIEKAKPKLPTELGTVLRHKERIGWAVVRVDSDGTPWLGSVENSEDHWHTDAEVQQLLDSGKWENPHDPR